MIGPNLCSLGSGRSRVLLALWNLPSHSWDRKCGSPYCEKETDSSWKTNEHVSAIWKSHPKKHHPSPVLRQWSRFPALKRLAPLFSAADEAERSRPCLGSHKFGGFGGLESGTCTCWRPRRSGGICGSAKCVYEPDNKGLSDAGAEELLCKCVGKETQDALVKQQKWKQLSSKRRARKWAAIKGSIRGPLLWGFCVHTASLRVISRPLDR